MPNIKLIANGFFEFSQGYDLLLPESKKIFDIAFSVVTHGNTISAKEFNNGLCRALSTKFLIEDSKYGPGGGQAYLSWLKRIVLNDITDTRITDLDSKYLINNIRTQYYRQFVSDELKSLLWVQYCERRYHNAKFIGDIIQDIKVALVNEDNTQRHVNLEQFIKLLKRKSSKGTINNERLINSLENTIKDKSGAFKRVLADLRKTGKGSEYIIDGLVNNLLYEQKVRNNDNLSINDFLNILTDTTIKEKNIADNDYTKILIEGGLYDGEDSLSKTKTEGMVNKLNPEKIEFNKLMEILKRTKENTFFSFDSPNHAMSISIFMENGSFLYKFFDPIIGIYTFDKINLFENFLDQYLKINGDMYLFNEKSNLTEGGSDFNIEYQKYQSNPNHINQDSMWKISRDGEKEYILRSLKEKNYKFSINKHHDAQIVDFNFETGVDGKRVMKSIIMELNTGDKLSRILIQPDYFDGILKEGEKRNVLNSDITDKVSASKQLADWNRVKPELIKSLDNDDGAGTQYDYQIIFQLSGEREIIEGDERLASKHPDKTVIIQYDINAGEHKIVYGDLEKSQGDNVRWVLSSHGSDVVDGTNTTLAGYKPNEVISGLQRIQEKLNLTKPKHVVIAGCNLGNERSISHFGLDFSRGLWATGINASVKAYNQDLTVNIIGQKNTIDSANQQHSKNKYHRIKYSKDEHGNIIVNDVIATSLLINDIINERVSVDDAINIYPDILQKDFSQDGVISREMILDVIDNDDSYLKFNEFLDKKLDKDISGDQSFADWSIRRSNNKSVLSSWGYVNAEEIYDNKLIKPTPLDYDYQVIIQLADDEVIVRSTQELASKHPDKTLIIQYDITSGESRFVYGNPNALSGDKIKWILTGHGDDDENTLDGHSADKVYSALQDLAKQKKLTIPERMVILSCELGKNPDTDGIVPHFALKYAEITQKNGENLSLRAYTQEVIVDDDGHRKTIVYGQNESEGQLYTKESSHRVDYQTTKNGQLLINDMPVASYILLDIAADKITPNEAIEKYSQYLEYYFADENNKIDKKLLAQAAHDPLVWQRFAEYAEKTQQDPAAHQYNNWVESTAGHKSRTLSQRVRSAVTVLDALAESRVSITQLHKDSKKLLGDFIADSDNPLLSREILKKINDPDSYLDLRLDLLELQQLSDNNSNLTQLTDVEALNLSVAWHKSQTDNNLRLMEIAGDYHTKNSDIKYSALSQSITLSGDLNRIKKRTMDLGVTYLYFSSKGNTSGFHDLLSRYQDICHNITNEYASIDEVKQLDKINQKINTLESNTYNDIALMGARGNLNRGIEINANGYYQVVFENNTINLVVENDDGNYRYRIYDPEAGELVFRANSIDDGNKVLTSQLTKYVSATNQNNLSFEINSFDFSSAKNSNYGSTLDSLFKTRLETERYKLSLQNDIILKEQPISLSTLYDMGVMIDGKLITVDVLSTNPEWSKKVCFDPVKLNEFYTLPDQTSVEQQQSVKVIKILLDNNKNLLNSHPDPNVMQNAARYIAAINKSVDLNCNIRPKLWDSLTQATVKSSRFQSFGQKLGAGTQAIGILTFSISSYGMTKRLQDPNITEAERAEIIKQLAIGLSSLAVDFGTDLMQPAFDKAYNFFTRKLLSGSKSGIGRMGYKASAKIVKHMGAALNVASAGFDIREAIDNFTKALQETNPDLKRDYIVNGSLSVVGAAVSIATAVALAMGLSAAGPIGIAVGATLMLGGMIYNAVRQVEYIKREIELTGWQEFKTGFRLAFGAEPEKEILNKLSAEQKRKMDNFRLELVKNTYTKIIEPMGFNTLLYVNEEVDITPVKKYIFIYKADSVYSHSTEKWLRMYTNDTATGYLPDKEVSDSISKDPTKSDIERYYLMRYKTKPLSENDYRKWLDDKNVDHFKFDIVEIHESDIDNRHAQDNVIIKNHELFMSHEYFNGIRNLWRYNEVTPTIEISKNIDGSINTNFNYYENVTESIHAPSFGNNPDKSTHFNPGRGSDLIIGYKEHRNSFDVGEGEKTFFGGDKEDTFYLMGDVRASTHSLTTVLDGQGGSDTLVLLGLRFGNGYDVDLAKNDVRYIGDELRLLSVYNIENVYGHDGFFNKIKGNASDNFLKVGNGLACLDGREGNDILALNRGTAIGGSGIDTYIISSNENIPIDVTIIDSGIDEVSTIILPVNVEDIRVILLEGNDVIISVDEEKYFGSKIRLKDVYKLKDTGDKKILSHNFIINTADSLILVPNWPKELDKNVNELPSSLEMMAYYNPMIKQAEKPSGKQEVTIYKRSYSQDSIIIDKEVNKLPDFIKSSLNGSVLTKNIIFSDGLYHKFENLGAGDTVTANGGDNEFHIPNLLLTESDGDSVLTIDCRLLINSNNPDNTVYLSFGDVTGYDLNVTKNRLGDLIISHRDKPNEFLSIDIIYLDKLKYKNNKVITFSDKNGSTFFVEQSGEGYSVYEESAVDIKATEGNDNINLPEGYRLLNNVIDLLDGDDVIFDGSGRGNTINGGIGNDILHAKSGNNRLNGGQGHDQLFSGNGNDHLHAAQGNDTLCSGGGIDFMDGGKGNDTFVIEKGQGITTIRDGYGKNRVHFEGIDYRELWFKKQNSQLLITIKGTEKEVIIDDYYSGQEVSSHFSFQTNHHKIEGDNLALLIDNMSNVPDKTRELIQGVGHKMYGADLNRAWALIAA
ncbi:C80 family cysteine peptidase [Yersinia intermedia]|uniref:C80 family cysteine peptidase n=1 Tax=Yersinia intermedia TaxID=631 RepID=UPI000B41368E|nr:C80 family cysteine peptidase [Yersinia intermedia]OVZ74522.1 hypothetical protein CBW55_14310 [Yersinia intermedia]